MKKTVFFLFFLIVCIIIFLLSFYHFKYAKLLDNENDSYLGNAISIMVPEGNGGYVQVQSDSWDFTNFSLNRKKSYCENSGNISFNYENNSVLLQTGKGDKCYLYFDYKSSCNFDGDLIRGAEFVKGPFTYRYNQRGSGNGWYNFYDKNGWGVMLTDKDSTSPVSSEEICSYINNIPVVATSRMFYSSKASSIDISAFDSSNVIYMDYMFSHISPEKLEGIEYLVTENVVTMASMFNSSIINDLNLSSFNTSNVIDMQGMFAHSKIPVIDLKSFNTSNVTNMGGMFTGTTCDSLDVSSFDTSKITSLYQMFYDSNIPIIDLSSFDTQNVTTTERMFYDARKTTKIILSGFDTSNITSMKAMFNGASSLEEIIGLEDFNTSSVIDMSNLFGSTGKLTSIDVSSFNTSSVTNMQSMFARTGAKEIKGIEKLDTSHVTNMAGMFAGTVCDPLDLSHFNTVNVTNMHEMFYDAAIPVIDLSSFDTTNVTDVGRMFFDARATIGYARTQEDADKFNSSLGKPEKLTFVVKPNV